MKIRLLLLAALSTALLAQAPQIARADEVEIPAADNSKAAEQEQWPVYYTIVKHDTLWDISNKFLENPFKWPKIWRRNPYIKNPHLIYPGNVLRITPDGIEVVEKAPRRAMPELPVVSLEPEKENVVVLEPPAEPEKVVPPPSGPKIMNKLFTRRGFISDGELDASGAIVASKEERLLIGRGDTIYVSMKDPSAVKPGDRYTVFEPGEEVTHPKTGHRLGYLVNVIGSITVTGTGDVIEARVDTSYREIYAGTRLMPFVEPVSEIEIKKPGNDVEGFVVASDEGKEELAAGDIIYIDKGKDDGVLSGNLMRVFRINQSVKDPMRPKGGKITLPLVDLGTVIVIEAKDRTSACFILESYRAINRGDSVSTLHVD